MSTAISREMVTQTLLPVSGVGAFHAQRTPMHRGATKARTGHGLDAGAEWSSTATPGGVLAGAWRAQPCGSKSSPRAQVLSLGSSKDVISSPAALIIFRNAALAPRQRAS